MYNDCAVYLRLAGDVYEGPDELLWVPPGGQCVADVQPMFARLVRPFVHVGSRFTLCEGHRVVADAEVQRVLDPGPELDLD